MLVCIAHDCIMWPVGLGAGGQVGFDLLIAPQSSHAAEPHCVVYTFLHDLCCAVLCAA